MYTLLGGLYNILLDRIHLAEDLRCPRSIVINALITIQTAKCIVNSVSLSMSSILTSFILRRHAKTSYSTCPVASGLLHLQAQVSNTIHIDCGVPQGSVLGPKTFIAYVDEMEDIFVAHGLHYHAFADDTQTYTDVPRSHSTTVAPRLQNCLAEVSTGAELIDCS